MHLNVLLRSKDPTKPATVPADIPAIVRYFQNQGVPNIRNYQNEWPKSHYLK